MFLRNIPNWVRLVFIPWPLYVLVAIPFIYPDPYFLHIAILSMIMASLASSWNLVAGYAGIFSFGHQAFFGLGAYFSALLSLRLNISPWLSMPLAAILVGFISILISGSSLRLRGTAYISIATLCFAEICRISVANLVNVTRGELGLWGIPPLWQSFDRRFYYYTILLFLGFIVLIMRYLSKSPFGLALNAIRESQDAADSLGVNVAKIKVIAFIVSSSMAGFIGAFYAHYIVFLTPSSVFSIRVMIEIVTVTLIGGAGTWYGPVIAAFILTFSLEYFRWLEDFRLLIYGFTLLIWAVFYPELGKVLHK